MENNKIASNYSADVENLIIDGKNKFPIICVRCPSKILNSITAEYEEKECLLPLMNSLKNKPDDSLEKEMLSQYWTVKDKFTFENIGFSNTVSGLKYLICADCEIGPIGWFDPISQLCYVSVSRVKYQY